MKIVLSVHARHRMEERAITEEEIRLTLESPDQERTEDSTHIAMKIRSNGHLVIVIYRESQDTYNVITVIDTSKVHKYL